MAALDLDVRRGSRHEDTIQADGDPADADWLRRQLRGWLSGHKWHPSRWGEFEMVARPAGRGKRLAKVRA